MLSFLCGLARWLRTALTKRRELGRTFQIPGIRTIHGNAKGVNGDGGRGRTVRCSAMMGGRGDDCHRDEGGRADLWSRGTSVL